jgi:hypothetical protein
MVQAKRGVICSGDGSSSQRPGAAWAIRVGIQASLCDELHWFVALPAMNCRPKVTSSLRDELNGYHLTAERALYWYKQELAIVRHVATQRM